MRLWIGVATIAMTLGSAPALAHEPRPVFQSRGAFFALSVPDLAASERWYTEKLGLKLVTEVPARNGTAMKALEGGGLLVELIQQDKAVSLRTAAPQVEHETGVHGVFKAGVMVDDWNGLLTALRVRGVPIAIGPFPASAEQRENLIIQDNDGNYIQFFGDYARPNP